MNGPSKRPSPPSTTIIKNWIDRARDAGDPEGSTRQRLPVPQHQEDDDVEPERDHGEVVVLHFQRRKAEHQAPRERDDHADREADLEGDPVLAEDRHRVGAEGHEGRVAERDLARVPEGEVEADGEDHVDERQAHDVELVLVEPEGHDHAEREGDQEAPAATRHDAHSSLTPQIPSGLSSSTAMRMTSAKASRKWLEM